MEKGWRNQQILRTYLSMHVFKIFSYFASPGNQKEKKGGVKAHKLYHGFLRCSIFSRKRLLHIYLIRMCDYISKPKQQGT